ncbi:MAG: hypothetical protein AAF431_03540 [Pseudomonadota bacterium]
MYTFNLQTETDITARSLALSMISVANNSDQSIGELIRIGNLLSIEASTIRVAVTRLLREGMLSSKQRGYYQPGAASKALTNQLRNWSDIESRVRPWSRDWITVHISHLGRSNRKKLRKWTRALTLYGYAEVHSGFYVRPANLSASLGQHREELVSIGLDEAAIMMHVSEVASGDQQDWHTLWPLAQLRSSYDDAIDCMQSSLEQLPGMNVEQAAKETLLVGQSVIRTINYDPLLPEEIGDSVRFLEMLKLMVHYNEVGQSYWREFQAR